MVGGELRKEETSLFPRTPNNIDHERSDHQPPSTTANTNVQRSPCRLRLPSHHPSDTPCLQDVHHPILLLVGLPAPLVVLLFFLSSSYFYSSKPPSASTSFSTTKPPGGLVMQSSLLHRRRWGTNHNHIILDTSSTSINNQ